MTQPVPPPEPVEEPAPPGAESLVSAEAAIAALVLGMYVAWLSAALAAVLAPFTAFGLAPDPSALWRTVPVWERQVDRLITALLQIARTGWIDATTQLGVDVPFDPTDPVLQDQLARTRNLMVRTPDEVYRRILFELDQAVGLGETVAQQAQRVRNVLMMTGTENWPARARTVAVTEVHRAYNFGGFAGAMRAQQDIAAGVRKRWDSKNDSAVRPAHRAADGQTQPLMQPFHVGGEALWMPGDPAGFPWNVINCVPGDTPIVASGVVKGFRYTYTGRMLAVARENGCVLTVSPNHPVLSGRGWVLARQLNVGDYLLCAGDGLTALRVDPNVESVPTQAEKVFGSLMQSGVCERVEGLPVYFHGDGGNGDVDIVFVDGELSFGLHPQQRQLMDELNLIFADAPDASGGTLDQLLVSSRDTPDSVMGFEKLLESLTGLHATPLNPLRFGSSSDGDSVFGEMSQQCRSGDTSFNRKYSGAFPIEVSLGQVVDVTEFDFCGHLYTFETTSGVYLTDAVVSHNCRCKVRFMKGGTADGGQR